MGCHDPRIPEYITQIFDAILDDPELTVGDKEAIRIARDETLARIKAGHDPKAVIQNLINMVSEEMQRRAELN